MTYLFICLFIWSLAAVGKKKMDDVDDLKCPICLEPFTEPLSCSCGHTFCRFCIRKWRETSRSCPVCKQDLVLPERENVILKNAVKARYPDFVPEPSPRPDSPATAPVSRAHPSFVFPSSRRSVDLLHLCDRCVAAILVLSDLDPEEDLAELVRQNSELLCPMCRGEDAVATMRWTLVSSEHMLPEQAIDFFPGAPQPEHLIDFFPSPVFPAASLTTSQPRTIGSRKKSWCPANSMCAVCKSHTRHVQAPGVTKRTKRACLARPDSEKRNRAKKAASM